MNHDFDDIMSTFVATNDQTGKLVVETIQVLER